MNDLIQKLKLYLLVNFFVNFWKFTEKIEIKIANSQRELEEVFRFRYRIYLEEDYINNEDFPNGLLTDKYDENSINLIAYKNNLIIGTLRLVLPTKLGLPTQKAFNIIDINFPEGKIGEISKLCILKEYRKTKIGRKISLALLSEIYKLSKKNKINYWLIGTPMSLIEYFKNLRFKLEFKELSTGPLSPRNLEERKTAKKYFEKFQIKPFLLDIRNF